MRIQELDTSEYIKKSLLNREKALYNKKISAISVSERNKKIAKKVLIASGAVTLAAIVGYSIYKNGVPSDAEDWMRELDLSGAFGNARLFTDAAEGGIYAKEHLWNKTWWNNLNKFEKKAIKSYTGNSYKIMNRILRSPNDHGLDDDTSKIANFLVNECTKAMQKASLPEDAIVHRGVGSLDSLAKTINVPLDFLKSPSDAKKLIGADFIDPAFGSTGASTKDAWSGVKMHMLIPKGSQAMYVDPVSSVPGEHEILINRNARYIIKDIRFGSTGKVEDIFVELIENVL